MKIFNIQRFNMIPNSKFKKYMIYAFGEIVLVIFGILIALGINNWNQKQQLKTKNKELQEKVLLQLDKDITYINEFKNDISDLNQAYLKVLGKEYDKTRVSEGGMVNSVLFSVNTLSLDQHLNNLIDNAVLDDSKASQEIIELRSTYRIYLKDISDIEDLIYKKMTDNLEHIERTQSWYSELITDFICKNDCINYLLHNPDHKSRIATLRFLYVNGYGSVLDGFTEDLIQHKSAILELKK